MTGIVLDTARLTVAGAVDRIAEAMSDAVWARPGRGDSDLDLDRCVRRGLRFLGQHQRKDGSFRGFLLFPGASSEWITAHVAFVLEDVPEATDICERAARYLQAAVSDQLGCGYNARVGEDNDSTAQALLVIHRFGFAVEGPALRALVESRFPDGGFPTYRPTVKNLAMAPNGWYYPHGDVTAIVITLLERLGAYRAAANSARQWLSEQLVEGLLPAYWWTGWHYGLWAQSLIGLIDERSLSMALDLASECSPHPFTGIALNSVLRHSNESTTSAKIATSAHYLCSTQWGDGSWSCDPVLRVTSRRVVSAGPDIPGRTYRDRRRVFSTAHNVAALWQFATARTPS
jgi:hypothetical protein